MYDNINDRQKAIDKLKELVEEVKVCMFATIDESYQISSRPMQAIQVDEEGTIWFFTNEFSGKVDDISKENTVYLMFSHPGKNSYLHVKGTCEVLEDRQKIDELWSPVLKAWFPEGKDDPRLCLLKVDTAEASYWDSSSSKLVVFANMLKAIVSDKQDNQGKAGTLNVS